jgi:hypothetical protein
MDILKTDFLKDYAEHLKQNPESLLSRILGVYEMKINKMLPM